MIREFEPKTAIIIISNWKDNHNNVTVTKLAWQVRNCFGSKFTFYAARSSRGN